MEKNRPSRKSDQPVVLVKWYDYTKWVLDRVDQFPKKQRFVLGTRLADAVMEVLELLSEAAYSPAPAKGKALADANRKLEVLRRIIRMAHERGLLTGRQYA